MKVLVTGATGFIGKQRVRHLTVDGNDVISIGRTHASINGSINFSCDISEKDSIKELVARYLPDRIEHFASQATVSVSRADPYNTYKDNVLGVVSVLEVAKEFKIPILVFTTDKYYGDLELAGEDDRPIITSGAYETSKFCQDVIAQSYRVAGIQTTIIRSCNVFGPSDYNRRIVPNTIRTLQANQRPKIFTNIPGIRQYIYITDLFSALDTVLEKRAGETFNVGTDIHLAQKDVVELIVHLWNEKYQTNIKPIYDKGPDMKEIPQQFLKWTKLNNLGWKPEYTFVDALKEMI